MQGNQIYNTLLHNNMEITTGKQAPHVQGRRKWVRETKGVGKNQWKYKMGVKSLSHNPQMCGVTGLEPALPHPQT